jgi:hypothetical protein
VFDPGTVKQIIDLYVDKGWGLHRIGAMFGLSGRPIETTLRKVGVKIRDKRESKMGDLNPAKHRQNPCGFSYVRSQNKVMTKAEGRFAQQFPGLEYYYPIATGDKQKWGTWVFTVDFYDPQANLAFEIDGPTHRYSKRDKDRDARKEAFLKECGIPLLRLSNEEVFRGDFIQKVVSFYANYQNASHPWAWRQTGDKDKAKGFGYSLHC